MPIKDLEESPVPTPREVALTFELLVRFNPELDWWPKWRDRGDDAATDAPGRGWPPSLPGSASAAIPDDQTGATSGRA
ncbi:hypothetical protein ASE95_02280 [Sphingomonas sp. Leaf231]|uniref:hypothetical protein n=1 Tax=Sphingomonas sp. Leaf231 TaxID=1736301 RepID=UPI0006FC75E1|nr:hypothetical protein [Sphingomonas sp. Leaf231]KQN93770.1 hypothetical protein ASE95_02280 [Sphingomonas sp. Leaf231]